MTVFSLRHKPLVACLATALLIAAPPSTGAQAPSDSSWIQFRGNTAARLFPQLPAPRSSAPARAPAATLTVTNCADDGAGSLRATIAAASDGDSIDLSALHCGKITLETGAIPIMLDSLTLEGPAAAGLVIDGNQHDRVLLHYGGGVLTLHNLTVSGGYNRATGFDVAGGGCIASAGYISLDHAIVSQCYAGGEGAYGGALYAYSLTMQDSTLSANHAYGVHPDAGTAAFGGAAFVYAIDLTDSTVSGNVADHRVNAERTSYDIGGGIIAVRGGSVRSSTIDTNVSQGRGGGLATFGNVAFYNSTVSENLAATDVGGGLFIRSPSTLQLINSTIAENHAGNDGGGVWVNTTGNQFNSSIVFGNSSDIGDTGNPYSATQPITIGGSNNLIGSSAVAITLPADTLHADPLLQPLDENGGPTRTHALGVGSPAIDTGSNADGLPFDQRGAGFSRAFGAAPDIGSFEQQAIVLPTAQVPVPALSTWANTLLATLLATIMLCTQRRRRDWSRLPRD